MCGMCSVRHADKEEPRIINVVFFSESCAEKKQA
jgi:hypothetical protein